MIRLNKNKQKLKSTPKKVSEVSAVTGKIKKVKEKLLKPNDSGEKRVKSILKSKVKKSNKTKISSVGFATDVNFNEHDDNSEILIPSKSVVKVRKLKTKKRNAEKNPKNPKEVCVLENGQQQESSFEISNPKNVKKIVKDMIVIASNQISKMDNQLFKESGFKFILDVTYFKIPLCPKRLVKIELKHSLISDEDDVILFVKDLRRGSRVDFEPTIKHYEDLLRKNNITGIKTVMPFRQLKTEYGSYEMKIKLSNLYDRYLCDGAIVGHVFGFLGKKFQNPRCTVYAVRMNAANLAEEFEKVKRKTSFKQGSKGSLVSVPIGTHKMKKQQIAENILDAISQLKNILPGGQPNIRNMYLRVNIKGTPSLPLYVNVNRPPSETPNIIGPKEKKLQELQDESNKLLKKFRVVKSGKILPKKKKIFPLGVRQDKEFKRISKRKPVQKGKIRKINTDKKMSENKK